MENEDSLAIVAVKYSARWFDNLPIPRLSKLRRTRTTLRLLNELFDVAENSLNQLPRCLGFVEGDVISDGVEVIESRVSPD